MSWVAHDLMLKHPFMFSAYINIRLPVKTARFCGCSLMVKTIIPIPIGSMYGIYMVTFTGLIGLIHLFFSEFSAFCNSDWVQNPRVMPLCQDWLLPVEDWESCCRKVLPQIPWKVGEHSWKRCRECECDWAKFQLHFLLFWDIFLAEY